MVQKANRGHHCTAGPPGASNIILLQRCLHPISSHLNKGHVDVVDVRSLLPVHLDGHVAFVEDSPDVVVLEGLPLHHVAPVAGGVAHREEDGLVLAASFLEGLLPPGVPVEDTRPLVELLVV